MEKVKIQGFGNEDCFYYFLIKKKGFSYTWLITFAELVEKTSSSKTSIGACFNRVHDADDNLLDKMLDKYESFSADNARIDLFYGKEIIYLTVISKLINKEKFFDAMEKIAEFP